LQAKNFQNASELYGKQLRFWRQKLRKCPISFFYEACTEKTSKIRLNVTANSFAFGRTANSFAFGRTANSFVFGRTNRENAPETFFVNLEGAELKECI